MSERSEAREDRIESGDPPPELDAEGGVAGESSAAVAAGTEFESRASSEAVATAVSGEGAEAVAGAPETLPGEEENAAKTAVPGISSTALPEAPPLLSPGESLAEPEATAAREGSGGEGGGEDFARLLGESDTRAQDLKVGDKVSGVLVQVGPENSFVDFGGRSEGLIHTRELQDENGEMLFSQGDPLEAFVVADRDTIELSRFLQQGDRKADLLYQAYKSGMPVEGKVTAVNQWGLGVEIQGTRAFCPISQIDTQYVENTASYRDQTMQFKIIRFRDQGRNIVVSRRVLLEEKLKKVGDSVRTGLRKGARLEGRVTRLESFGAFVDLGGGVEGLVHVSELSYDRVEHPREVLEEGSTIEVVVLRTKNLGNKRKERISLSIKALQKSPWDLAGEQFKSGTVVQGKVEALEDYGAFVEIAPRVRGMVHVSEIAARRIAHPRDVLAVGDEVKVVVLDVDTRRRRLRLSIKQAESLESATHLREFQQRQQHEQEEVHSSAMIDALKRAQLIE